MATQQLAAPAQAGQGVGGQMMAGGPPGGFSGRPGPRGGLMFLSPPVIIAVVAVFLLVTAIAFWQIYRKAGFSGLLSLAMLIPGVNLALMLWFAFTEWPVAKQLREQRAIAAMHAAEAGDAMPVDAEVAPA